MKIFHTLGRNIWQEETRRETQSPGQLRHQPGTSKPRAPTWSHNIRKRESAGWYRVENWMELTLFPAQAIVWSMWSAGMCLHHHEGPALTLTRRPLWDWMQKRLTHRDDTWVTQVPHMVVVGGPCPAFAFWAGNSDHCNFWKRVSTLVFISQFPSGMSGNQSQPLSARLCLCFFLSTHQ